MVKFLQALLNLDVLALRVNVISLEKKFYRVDRGSLTRLAWLFLSLLELFEACYWFLWSLRRKIFVLFLVLLVVFINYNHFGLSSGFLSRMGGNLLALKVNLLHCSLVDGILQSIGVSTLILLFYFFFIASVLPRERVGPHKWSKVSSITYHRT